MKSWSLCLHSAVVTLALPRLLSIMSEEIVLYSSFTLCPFHEPPYVFACSVTLLNSLFILWISFFLACYVNFVNSWTVTLFCKYEHFAHSVNLLNTTFSVNPLNSLLFCESPSFPAYAVNLFNSFTCSVNVLNSLPVFWISWNLYLFCESLQLSVLWTSLTLTFFWIVQLFAHSVNLFKSLLVLWICLTLSQLSLSGSVSWLYTASRTSCFINYFRLQFC